MNGARGMLVDAKGQQQWILEEREKELGMKMYGATCYSAIVQLSDLANRMAWPTDWRGC